MTNSSTGIWRNAKRKAERGQVSAPTDPVNNFTQSFLLCFGVVLMKEWWQKLDVLIFVYALSVQTLHFPRVSVTAKPQSRLGFGTKVFQCFYSVDVILHGYCKSSYLGQWQRHSEIQSLGAGRTVALWIVIGRTLFWLRESKRKNNKLFVFILREAVYLKILRIAEVEETRRKGDIK